MFINTLVFLFGGFWGIRDRINKTNFRVKKQFLIWIYTLYLQKKCCYIGHNTNIEGKITFPHGFYGVFISGDAIIGKNCVIFHNVTIGSNTLPDSKKTGSPKIGNNVFIGAGATIIGGISIGENCRIGANCTVSSDIPSNCLVIMEKPKIIYKGKMSNRYYTYSKMGWIYFDNGKQIIENDQKVIEILNKKFNK